MREIRKDDLTGEATRALLAIHLAGMHANSPPGHVFALALSGLEAADVDVWTLWDGGVLAGIGALRVMQGGAGEVKSMRTDPLHLRKGVASALLDHIIAEARARGLRSAQSWIAIPCSCPPRFPIRSCRRYSTVTKAVAIMVRTSTERSVRLTALTAASVPICP